MRHFEVGTTEGLSAAGLKIGVVASRYNAAITDALLEGALKALREAGAVEDDLTVLRVPGAFEVPLAVKAVLGSGKYDAVVALGCVVRGDTPHFDFIADQCAHGVMMASLSSGIPVAFGILTTNTQEQAEERSRPDETNKGREAALTAVEMALLIKEMYSASGRRVGLRG